MNNLQRLERIAELRGLLGELEQDSFPDLATNTKRVLASRGWKSYRWAERNTGISHTTIRVLKRGDKRVNVDTLLRFSRAIEEPAANWLEWGGYDPAKFLPAG